MFKWVLKYQYLLIKKNPKPHTIFYPKTKICVFIILKISKIVFLDYYLDLKKIHIYLKIS